MQLHTQAYAYTFYFRTQSSKGFTRREPFKVVKWIKEREREREKVGEFFDCIASPTATHSYLQEIFKASREESDREEEIKAKKPSWRRSRKFHRKLSLRTTDEFSFNVERKVLFLIRTSFFLSFFRFFSSFSLFSFNPRLILRVSKLGTNEKDKIEKY